MKYLKNILFFGITPSQRVIAIVSRVLLLLATFIVVLSGITLVWGEEWFSEKASIGAQALTASLAVIIASIAFLISLYIQSPTYKKEIRTRDQLKKLQNYLVNLYHREFYIIKKEDDMKSYKSSNFESLEEKKEINVDYFDRLNESIDRVDLFSCIDKNFDFESDLEFWDLYPSNNPTFLSMLEIDLTKKNESARESDLSYIFSLVTGDVGEFIYWRSNLSFEYAKENNKLWEKGYYLLCILSTGRFHLGIVEELLKLLYVLENREINDVCSFMIRNSHHSDYSSMIDKSPLLSHSDLKNGDKDMIHIPIYKDYANGWVSKRHTRFCRFLRIIGESNCDFFLKWMVFIEERYQNVLKTPSLSNNESYEYAFFNFLKSNELKAKFVKLKALSPLFFCFEDVGEKVNSELMNLWGKVQKTGRNDDFVNYAKYLYEETGNQLYVGSLLDYISDLNSSEREVFGIDRENKSLESKMNEVNEKNKKLKNDLRSSFIYNADPD